VVGATSSEGFLVYLHGVAWVAGDQRPRFIERCSYVMDLDAVRLVAATAAWMAAE